MQNVRTDNTLVNISELEMPLDRDTFCRALIKELAGTLEEEVGLEDASGFVSIVGQYLGMWINQSYKDLLHQPRLTRQQVLDVLVDLKARIKGQFYIIEQDDEKIIFGNRICPFENSVVGHPSMCMMTSNVFGSITAANLGYARVELQETIAKGDDSCRVVVHLKPNVSTDSSAGREYFKSES